MKTVLKEIFCLIIILSIFSGCSLIQKLGGAEVSKKSVNYALAANGGTVTASSYTQGRDLFTVINSITSSEEWDEGEGWECRFDRRRPDGAGWSRMDPRSNMEFGCAWLEVKLNEEKLINKVNIYTLDSSKYPAARYGIKEAWLQLWKEYGWTTVGEIKDGAITSRVNLDRQAISGKIIFKFQPTKTDRIRFVIFQSNDVVVTGGRADERKYENSIARVVEIEATGLEKTKEKKPGADKKWAEQAPEFYLQNLQGGWNKLSDFKGKIVVITFWAAWSPEAQRQVNEFNSLNSQYKGQDVVVLGISVDEGGAERIKAFVESSRLNYPILIADTGVKIAYGGIGRLPSCFIIDQDGNIYKKYLGYQAVQTIELDVKSLILRR